MLKNSDRTKRNITFYIGNFQGSQVVSTLPHHLEKKFR